ncbi:hypothetical protein B0H13DRAFT_2319286 [Mycena leptocephala]|nr:hypothetical protein B0H13DRAFT_2319286 [Mycena leptocephala]
MANASLLLEFPNELLLLISEELGTDDLLHLAGTCRRMNLLLIPIIFTRFDCDPPSSSGELQSLDFTGENLPLLLALGIASGVSSVNVIDCALVYDVREDREKVAALNPPARRLSHLGHVRFCPTPDSWVLKSRKLYRYTHAVAACLNSVARRGDCGLTVYTGWRDDASDSLPFVHTFQRLGGYLPSGTSPNTRNASCEVNGALDSQHLLLLPLARQPLQMDAAFAENTRPSRFLRSRYRRSHRSQSGPGASPSPRHLHLFLAWHPSIHTLDLSFYIGINDFVPSATTCILPRLEIIRAGPEYLLYFFSPGAEPDVDPQGWYPNLWRAVVMSHDESGYGVIQFRRVVACIETRPVVPLMELVGKFGE